MKHTSIKVVFSLLIFCASVTVSAQHIDSVNVRKSVDNFVHAFNTLSWEAFRNSFTRDATIFFPDWEYANRRSGINEIENTWLQLFPEFKDAANTLTLNINPKDVLIQVFGTTAIVTFHLGTGEKYVARRTLVMVNENNVWKIAHLHTSYIFKD